MATPIEQQMNGVDNMLYLQSTNANDGTLTMTVTFALGTDVDIDNVLVQNRYSQAQAVLPQEVKNYGVTVKKKLPFPLIILALYSPDNATTRSSSATTRRSASSTIKRVRAWAA